MATSSTTSTQSVTGIARAINPEVEIGQQPSAGAPCLVIGQTPLVETENASMGQVVSARTVQDLPIRGRNIFDLVGLAAGVQVNPRSQGGTASTGDNAA